MNVLIFPTGWMGGFGIINALIRPTDHIVMDYICHNCLQEGAISATKNLKRFEHLNQDEMERMLRETREQDPDNAILVVTEGLFSMDADSPDLIYYQQVAKKYNAYLLIDCAHDFGHLGPTGKGMFPPI
jgi:glycine C-acetyltransferase